MGIRNALSSVPAKPVMGIAFVLTTLVASWHGWTVHGICTSRATHSTALQEWAIEAIEGAEIGSRMDSRTSFDWDNVRISQGAEDRVGSQNCPFGWHWNNSERSEMAAADNLTLIGFFRDGGLVEIVDFDRRWAEFDTDGEAISRDQAVFVVAPGSNILRLVDTGS